MLLSSTTQSCCGLMSLNVSIEAECLLTMITFKVVLSCMCTEMFFHAVWVCEAFVTHCTCVGILANVAVHVSLQVSLYAKCLSTQCTRERTNTSLLTVTWILQQNNGFHCISFTRKLEKMLPRYQSGHVIGIKTEQ